jgi:hypothetical protein
MSIAAKLWEILDRYDSQPEMVDFCNSLSKAIQGYDLSDNDILNIAAASNLVESSEIQFIDRFVGICNVVF